MKPNGGSEMRGRYRISAPEVLVRHEGTEALTVQHIRDGKTGQAFLAAWTRGFGGIPQCQVVPYVVTFVPDLPPPKPVSQPEPHMDYWL